MSKTKNIKDDDNEYNYIVGNEKTGLDKFLQDVKDSTFSVLFVLLKEDEEGLFMFCIQTILDYIQMLEFIFNEKINHVWEADDVLQNIFDFFGFFDIGQYMGSAFNWTIYLISFYFCILAIVLTVVDIIYVSYSFNRKRFSVLWPLIILRNVVTLSVTVFFLPITEFLIGMVECESMDDGRFVHNSYPEIECWRGMHIIHGLVALINTVVFVTISIIVALNYFESRITSNDPTARSNSRADVVFILNKIMLQVTFAFIPSEWDWPLVIVIFVGGFYLWYLYQFDDPYYNEIISKLFKICSAYYMWTCSTLFFAKIMENTSFRGGLISWIIGLPFIIIIVLSQSKGNLKTLTKSQVRFETPNELMDHLRFVLQLIEKEKTDRNSHLLLAGYIEKHKEECKKSDCPLKMTKKKNKSNHGKGLLEMTFQESVNKLIQVIDRMYIDGLSKFKRSAKLRIVYAFFLLERLHKKKEALEELSIAETLKPHFDEQFLIYRYKKMIEDQLGDNPNAEAGGQGDLDIVGMIAFENHRVQCEEFIKQASHHHKEFWLELLEDIPNIERLNFIGSKINLTVKNARDNWKQLTKINANVPSVLKLFGKFSIHVLNERAVGKSLIEKSKKIALLQMEIKKDENDIENLTEPIPMVVVGSHKGDMGFIKNTNLLFSALFGYTKEDVLDKNIKKIMPDLYAKEHDTFISQYMESNFEKSDYMDRENSLFGKSKTNYIFPMMVKVRLIANDEADEEIKFVGTFKTEPMLKNYIYFIVDRDGRIFDLSSNAMTYFNFDYSMIKKNKIMINSICPKAIVDHNYRQKHGKEVEYRKDGNYFKFICFMENIMFRKDREDLDSKMLKGFVVKLEVIVDRKNETFTELYRNEADLFMGSANDVNTKLLELETNLDKRGDIFEFFNDAFQESDKNFKAYNIENSTNSLDSSQKKDRDHNYAEGITSKRLIKGHFYDIDLLEYTYAEKNKQEFDLSKSIFKNYAKYANEYEEEANSKKRQDVIKETINNVRELKSIKWFKILSFLYISIIIALSSFLLNSANDFFASTTSRIDILLVSNKEINLLSQLSSFIYDLEFLVQEAYTPENFKTYDAVFEEINQVSNDLIINTFKLDEQGYLATIGKEGERFKLYDYSYIKDPVKNSNSFIEISFNHQIDYLVSLTVNLTKNYRDTQGLSNVDIVSFKYNLYSELYQKLKEFGDLLYRNQSSKINSVIETQYPIILLLVSEVILTFGFIIYFLWIERSVDQKKEEILFLFLDIPRKEVTDIYRKCENFLNFCNNFTVERQNDNRLLLESSDEEDSFEKEMINYIKGDNGNNDDSDEDFGSAINKKKILRRYRENRQKAKMNKNVLFIAFLAIAFGFSNMVGIYIQQLRIKYYLMQINSNTLMQSHFLSCLNFHRQAMIDPGYTIMNTKAVDQANNCIKSFFENEADLFEFQNYISSHSTTFTNLFEKAYFDSVCEIINDSDNCKTLINGNLNNGINFLQNYIFDWMDRYNNLLAGSENSALERIKEDEYYRGSMIEINIVLKNHLTKVIDILIESELEEIKERSDSTNRILLISLIVYIIILLFFYAFWIYPKANRLNTEIKVTIKMLNMIPANVIVNISSIRNYLMKLSRSN